jgi:hypothetical protein
MLETILKGGASADWLPTHEATAGTGGLCSNNIQNGIHKGKHKYLPFAKNGINWVASQGEDVLSYNFTGCIMAVFDHGGVRKVCHVSTGDGQDCKAQWDTIKGQSKNVFEFKPSDFIETKGAAFGGCCGLITADLRTYSITLALSKGVRTVANIQMARLLK